MKTKLSYAVVAMLGNAALPAHAQSSVTIYGLLDVGLTYISNQNGHSNLRTDDGINRPTLLGFRGVEDLGGGTRAVFELTTQFSIDNGNLLPGQSLFSRTAYVGLDSDHLGRLTLGNQYDFMTDSLFFGGNDPAADAGHLYGFRAGPFRKLGIPDNPTGDFDWDRMAAERIANSVKYLSPTYAGWSFGAMYGFGNVAGSIGTGNSSSFGLNYVGAAFGFNAAYTDVKYVTAVGEIGIRNWGIGAHYNWEGFIFNGIVTTVRNTVEGGAIAEASGGVIYYLSPDWSVGAVYMYMKGNDVLNNNHAHQISAILDHALSKRTSVYLMSVYQRTNAGAQALINGLNDPNDSSSGPNQLLVRVGLHTVF
ncbi:porin [Paraburkholderia sediminicola]|uniref:porin n=1 Tax=Paraburkholderia sediminicola TaxID=458836 RepID=UPI0038BC6023